jgi:hypothetical protein
MSITVQEIIDQARLELLDSEDLSFTDAQMVNYCSQAQIRFCSETHCYQHVIPYTVIQGYVDFSTLAGLVAGIDEIGYVTKVRLNSGTRYPFLPKALLSETKDLLASTVTTPTRFTLFAERVIFDLHPDAIVSQPMSFYCSATPVAVTTVGDIIVTPLQWKRALVAYVKYMCHLTQRDSGLATGDFAEYETIRVQAATFYAELLEGVA